MDKNELINVIFAYGMIIVGAVVFGAILLAKFVGFFSRSKKPAKK